jgi:hypothetical protein
MPTTSIEYIAAPPTKELKAGLGNYLPDMSEAELTQVLWATQGMINQGPIHESLDMIPFLLAYCEALTGHIGKSSLFTCFEVHQKIWREGFSK